MLKKLWRIHSRRNLEAFSNNVLDFKNADHHKDWYRILQNGKLSHIALAAPRGHTKTTCFSVNYPLWEISRNANVRILLVSNAETQSQSFLREIVSRIERDETYVDYAGQLKPDKPDKWSAREVIIKRPQLNLKDPTISTVGVGGTILSKRADIIICDDVLNFENTRTLEQRQKLKEWFYSVLLPVLAPGGRVIFVGTVWHPQDLLNELLADPGWDYRKKYKAIVQWPTNMDLWQEWYGIRMEGTEESKDRADLFFTGHYKALHEGVQVMWPDYFTFASLYLIWRSNRVAFEKAYQNNIVSREDQKFKEEWLVRAMERGANLRLMKSMTADQRKEFKGLAGGIDLAASEKEQADDNVMLSLGLRRLDDMVQLLGLERGKYSPNAWRKTIGDNYRGFVHDRIIVESNAYQVSLTRDMQEQNLPIVGFTTGGEKFDPYIGVESLAILFENDRIILPYDKTDPTTVAAIDQLVDELRSFPVGHTGDSAMALWFAYTALRDLMTGPDTGGGFMQIVKKDLQTLKENQKAAPQLNAWAQLAKEQHNKAQ